MKFLFSFSFILRIFNNVFTFVNFILAGTRVDTGTFTRPKKGSKESRRRLEYANDLDADEPAMPKPISRDELMTDAGKKFRHVTVGLVYLIGGLRSPKNLC